MKTEDCKKFIADIAETLGEDSSESWSRVRKYQESGYVLRDFKNSKGRVLTIGENNAKCFLYQLWGKDETGFEKDFQGVVRLGHKAKQSDIVNFMVECIKKDNSIVWEEDLSDACNPKNWIIAASTQELDDRFDTTPHYQVNPYDESLSYLELENILEIHWVILSDHDTNYRIFVYETTDFCLILGHNDPD